jgi:hypothetical protein
MFVAALVVPERAAHSRGMRLRELGIALVALCLSGCSSSSDSEAGHGLFPRGWNWGGQTGSLTPMCGPTLAEPVPEGSNGIVVNTTGCARLPTASDVQLTTESGEAIQVEWVPLGNGRYLVRPTQSLDRGQYRVSIAGASQSVQVGASSPKPVTLGALQGSSSVLCSMDVDLVLDDAVLPYASLLRIGVELDGVEQLHSDHGQLVLDDKVLNIRCDNCLTAGTHVIQAFGEIAGEGAMLATPALTVVSQCTPPSDPDDGDASMVGCGVARVPSSGSGGVWGGLALGMLALLRRARAKKTGGS